LSLDKINTALSNKKNLDHGNGTIPPMIPHLHENAKSKIRNWESKYIEYIVEIDLEKSLQVV